MKRKCSMLLAAAMLLTMFVLPTTSVGAASTRPRTATVEELEAANATRSGYPSMVKVADGDLYVWGANSTTSAIGAGGQTGIASPIKIDRSVFGGEAVKVAQVADWATAAITEGGHVYVADTNTWHLVEFDFGGATPVSINTCALQLNVKAVKDGKVSWWKTRLQTGAIGGWSRVDNDTLLAGMKAATGNDEVIKDFYGYSSVNVALTESNKIFTWGGNGFGNIGNNYGQTDNNITEPKPSGSIPNVPESEPYHVTGRSEFAGRTIKQLSMHYSTIAVLDDRGTVWVWGSSSAGKLGNGKSSGTPWTPGSEDTAKPYPVFGPGSENAPAEKGHYIVASEAYLMGVITTDNKLYAWGEAAKYLIKNGASYLRPAEVFENITTQETVLSMTGPGSSVFVTCLSGNTYFSGDAVLSGTGQTSGTIESGKVETENTPPTKPQSTNRIYTTIKTTTDDGTPIEYAADLNNIENNRLRVGQQFTLNVYFEDFAQLTAFYVPLSFNPSILQVTNLSGRPYSGDDVVHPGFNGASGIRTKLGIGENDPTKINTTWVNGVLTDNSRSPVVDNQNGYVLVEGMAKLEDGVVNRITGKVQMFSIEFKAIAPTTGSSKIKFDVDGNEADPIWSGAAGKWFSTKMDFNKPADVDKVGIWDYELGEGDFFETQYYEVPIEDMLLNLYRDEDSLVTDTAKDEGDAQEHYRIDKRNTDANYKVKAEVKPENSSWPDIDSWECTFMEGKAHPASATVSDYINVLTSDHPNYFEFVISDGLSSNQNVQDETGAFQPAYIAITAKGQHIPNKGGVPAGSRTIYIKITDDVPAPTKISITNKDSFLTDQNGKFLVNATSKTEFEKKGVTLDDTFTFTASFEAEDMDDFGKDVKWQLLNVTEWEEDGVTPKTTVPLGTDANAPAVIVPDSSGTKDNPTCKVQAQQSTDDDDDIILKISSAIDPAIYDYVPIQVRLAPYDIVLPVESIVLVYGTGMKKTYSLPDNVRVVPGSAVDYTMDYVKTVQVHDERTEAELDGDSKRTSPNVMVTDKGIIEPIRSDKEFSANSYDIVTVQIPQTLAGKDCTLTKTLKVYTVDAVPPENMYVEVRNNAGIYNDYIKFSIGTDKSQLEVGDTLYLYRDFADTEAVAKYESLTDVQIKMLLDPGYNVPTRTVGSETYALNPAGGTVGYQLIKKDGTSYKKTPVMYNPKALKLSGFIKLDGKALTKSSHDGITITLSDVVGSDGRAVSTTTRADGVLHGYFEFEEYISAKPHTMTISKTNYLSRQVTFTMPMAEDFEISTAENPILLFPGDLDGKRGIQYDDLNEYRTNWVGRYRSRGENATMLENFNFFDANSDTDTVINLYDLLVINMRMGMMTENYSPWTVE